MTPNAEELARLLESPLLMHGLSGHAIRQVALALDKQQVVAASRLPDPMRGLLLKVAHTVPPVGAHG